MIEYEIIEHEPYEKGGIKYGKNTILKTFPKTPWYKSLLIKFEIWWKS